MKHLNLLSGDLEEVKRLRKEWQRLVESKIAFVDSVSKEALNPYQLAEMEVTLAKLTGEIKQTDAMINYLLFGTDIKENYTIQPLFHVWNAIKVKDECQRIKDLLAENRGLIWENCNLKKSNQNVKSECSKLRGMIKKRKVVPAEDIFV